MKKYLAIFLIFFLLFGVSVPVFASTNTPIAPVLDNGYDSFAIIDGYLFDTSTMDAAEPAYICYLYKSSDWQFFHVPNDMSDLRFRISSFSNPPSDFLESTVLKSSYDSTSANNGWGTFEKSHYNSYNINNQIEYARAFSFTKRGLDYYDSETNTFSHNPVLLSNRDVYNGTWSASTGSDISNEVFFSPTPPLIVETEKALTLFQTQMSRNLMTIALCGVGCLAFLISLPILRKVLLRFLNR